jgi:serine/threonine-protein kinase
MSTPRERWLRAEGILSEVLGLPEAARAAAALRLCGDDAELAAELGSLLEHSARVGDFLEQPALGTDFVLLPAEAHTDEGLDPLLGQTVGRYRIERRIASGGMGTVYLATRADEQFTQRVALKIVKRGMDTDEILGRFRRERQTLAALEHPNIARLIDGGATESGQPFLAMEFVEGEPIDLWCDARRLDIDARLELFLVVCEAVGYAHRNLVVHRDLKPGNILVTAEGMPKLLDFGIATVIEADGGRQVTAARDRRLTPEYASPEQVLGASVTTTSDVYSLGVILYELLGGGRPYHLATRTPADIQRAVAETLPLPPSEALRGFEPGEAQRAAAERHSAPAQLARRLRGDLDTIVLAALRKEPERRYASVAELATDIRRHLDRMPVSARPDTFDYRVGKFVQRHALASALVACSLLLLLLGSAGLAWQANLASHQRDRAVLARQQSEAINDFLQNMLASVDPARSGRTVTVREVLDDAARRLDGELLDQPLVRASLRRTIGTTYLALGLYDEAERQLREALRLRQEHLDPQDREVAVSMVELATLLHARHEFDTAGELLEGALAIFVRASGEESAEAATTLSSLGAIRRAQGRTEQAQELQRRALELRRRVGDGSSIEVAESLNNLASVLMDQQRFEEAQPLLEEALDIRRAWLGANHPLVAQSMDNLALLLLRRDAPARAEPLFREALALEERLLGPDHPDVAVTRRNLALLLARRGETGEAEEQLRQCLLAREKLLLPTDLRLITTRLDLAELLVRSGALEEGLALVESVLDDTRSLPGEQEARQVALARAEPIFRRGGKPGRAAEVRAELGPGGSAGPEPKSGVR